MGASSFETRFARSLGSVGIGDTPAHILVAFSGGLDSTVLLYLLRFRTPSFPLAVTAAHFDHRMRPSSGGDAEWVKGLCTAWRVPLETGVAKAELHNEEGARAARYEFLREAAARTGADRIATAHHADDQAETVLFRILRGTGLTGLGGIPARTRSGVIRPLLPFWREEIESYASANGLEWRSDPTNATYGPVRNRIRHEILPRIEREVSGSARRNLVVLAEQARESERGWREIVRPVYQRVVSAGDGSLLIDRAALARQGEAVASRVLRKALRRFGIVPDRSGTRLALTFITEAPSGREMQLSGGVRIGIEFDRARLHRERPLPEDTVVSIPLPGEDRTVEGEVVLGGRTMRISARRGAAAGDSPREDTLWRTRIPVSIDRFPLTVRSRAPGDRVRTSAGTKSLKKLMIEARVPASERAHRPVVVDSLGRVVWVPGLPVLPPSDADGVAIELAVRNG